MNLVSHVLREMKERLPCLHLLHIYNQGMTSNKKVYDVLNTLNIMEDLALYSPVLCGTIPIRIDTLQSDLDIVMEVHNF